MPRSSRLPNELCEPLKPVKRTSPLLPSNRPAPLIGQFDTLPILNSPSVTVRLSMVSVPFTAPVAAAPNSVPFSTPPAEFSVTAAEFPSWSFKLDVYATIVPVPLIERSPGTGVVVDQRGKSG
jgi:hypothetical protein